MAALPQIGSTLSLISNADIRYEGELFTVNPKECTIALCNVRSYGTEDRITTVRVEPHPNTYDYILFRGSDIKDIKIVGPPRRTIVSAASVSTVVDSQPAKPAKPTSSSNESDAANSSTATAVPTNAEKTSTRTTSSEDEIVSPIRKNNSTDLVDDSLKQQYIAGGGSSFSSKKDNRTNSTSTVLNLSAADAVKRQDIIITAQPLSISKQQLDGAVIRSTSSTSQSNSFKNHDSAKPKRNVADIVRSSAVQRSYQQTSFHQDGGGGGYHQKEVKSPQQNYYNEGGINKSLGKTTGQPGRYHRGTNFYGSRGGPATRYEDQINNNNRYYGGNVRNNEMFNRYRDMESNWHYGGAVSSATARANWGDRNYSVRNNGRMDGGSPGRFYNQPTMIYRPNARSDFRSTNNNANNNRKIMEFNSDYDFEQANMKFEELKSQLAKVKISSDGELTDDASNKDESSLNANVDESTDNSAKSTFYDKSKSFFDHISCETLEKSKGTPTRTNWRNERKLNSETFGTIAVRGGYRGGRGGYMQNRAANMRGAARSAGHYYGYGRY